jgi:regulator of sirC expression with transglutaminase-like and TPR domain
MNLDTALELLSRDRTAPLDLAELALSLATDQYPDLDVDAYLSELASMAHEAKGYLGGNLEAQTRGLCRYLFHDCGFRGNVQNYYDPRNSYLNEVLDRRTGLPITLSAVAIAVGGRAGLEVVGVGLPGHFVAKATAGGDEVMFDPFHGGRLLTKADCEVLAEQVTGTPFQATPDALQAVPAGAFALRILNNLKGAYLRVGEFPKAVRVIERLRQIDPSDVLQQRDLGVSLMRMGHVGRAINALSAYLSARPHAGDAELVSQLLKQAEGEVAKWN